MNSEIQMELLKKELETVKGKMSELRKSEKLIKDTLKLTPEDRFYFFSSLNKIGRDELIDNLFGDLVEE